MALWGLIVAGSLAIDLLCLDRYRAKKTQREGVQLWLILGDGVNQAADLASGATSIPSWNLTPWMTFGNWF
jgi:hypothetical protein